MYVHVCAYASMHVCITLKTNALVKQRCYVIHICTYICNMCNKFKFMYNSHIFPGIMCICTLVPMLMQTCCRRPWILGLLLRLWASWARCPRAVHEPVFWSDRGLPGCITLQNKVRHPMTSNDVTCVQQARVTGHVHATSSSDWPRACNNLNNCMFICVNTHERVHIRRDWWVS